MGEKGFFSYYSLSLNDIESIIKSEIDAGNAVMLHTQYYKDEHWVIVTSYTLDANGNIAFTYEDGEIFITGLGGIDPEEKHNENIPQKTNDLGKKATVDSDGGQWLNSDYTVRVYHP